MRWRTMQWRKPPSKLAGLGEHVISKRYGKRKSAQVVLGGRDTCTPAEGTVPLVPLFVALEYTNIECHYVQ